MSPYLALVPVLTRQSLLDFPIPPLLMVPIARPLSPYIAWSFYYISPSDYNKGLNPLEPVLVCPRLWSLAILLSAALVPAIGCTAVACR